jgi:hypothetical protein
MASITVLPVVLFLVLAALHVATAVKVEPIRVFILAGDGAAEGYASLAELKNLTESDPDTYGHLRVDENVTPTAKSKTTWKVRDDVYVTYQGPSDRLWEHKPLSADMGLAASQDSFGPEIQMGYILGEVYKEPIVIIKCAWDNKSLAKDFRPPSAGGVTGVSFMTDMDQGTPVPLFLTLTHNITTLLPSIKALLQTNYFRCPTNACQFE